MRVAFLGPAGTFTEEAATIYAPQAELVPYATIHATAEAVTAGEVDEAVVPIENSLQGAVTDTLDVLIHGSDGPRLRGEFAIPIVHNLVARPGTALSSIHTVYSHPQALAQCRRYLTSASLTNATAAASLSTAAAVEQAMAEEGAAAIAPLRAAQLYGAEVLAADIQDDPSNTTRFVVLGADDHPQTGDDKTSVCISFDVDKPGQLYSVMGEFANRGLNLSKIESRPTRMGLGQYYFLIDIDGHRLDASVNAALEQTSAMVSLLKLFGSYPRYKAP